VPGEAPGDRTAPCDEEHTGVATPDADEGAAGGSGGGFVATPPPAQADSSQEWVMLELEPGSGSGSAGTKPTVEPLHLGDKTTVSPSVEAGDGQPTSVPSSPVLSHMSMPGAWLLGHRRLTGMLGQMPSIMNMSRSQMEQVSLVH